jgi:DNA polymerase V
VTGKQPIAELLFYDMSRAATMSPRPVLVAPPVPIPRVLSRISCGWPSPAEEYYDGPVDLSRHLIRNPAATFLVRAAGDSMSGAGISDGDELVVDRSAAVTDGRIVVAIVDAEMLIKRLVRVAGGWVLRAANPDYPDIPVRGEGARVWGVVTAVIHHV